MHKDLSASIQKLHAAIAAHPELHTRSFSFGARVYDKVEFIGGKLHYVRVSFDMHPEKRKVTILATTIMEVSGPH